MSKIDLSRRPQTRADLASWYAQALREQEESGLSVSEYAGVLGVTAATLYQWRRRLAAEHPSALKPRGEESCSVDSEPQLIELLPTRGEVVPRSSVGKSGFVVRLGTGYHVEVPQDFDAASLTALITTLESC